MKNWLVYALVDDEGNPFYVGATCKPKRRLKEHRTTFGRHIEMEILESGFASAVICGEAERKHIAAMRNRGIRLLNVSNGGFVGRVHRESTRAKLSKAFSGRPVTWGHKIADATKGKPHNWTPEGKQSSSRTQFKKGVTSEYEQKRKANQRAYLKSLSYEKRSEISARNNRNWWANATPEQRENRLAKMLAARDPSKMSRRAIEAAAKRCVSPERREAFGQRIKNFWANMRPEQREDYLRRRGQSIAAAKAAKKK